jgi:hypothetical protein
VEDIRTCHCGRTFENTRRAGGPRRGGPAQVHCSRRCTQIATQCRFYGITTEEYWRLERLGCPICGTSPGPNERRMAIDHDHLMGRVRGRLCNTCNRHRVGANTLETSRKVVAFLEADATKHPEAA